MKLVHLITAFAVVAAGGLIILHFVTSSSSDSGPIDSRLHEQYDVSSLLELIRVQNETIHTLEKHLKYTVMSKADRSAEDTKLLEIAGHLERLSRENEQNRQNAANCHKSSHELENNFDQALQQARLDGAAAVHCPEPLAHSGAAAVAPTTTASYQWPTTKFENECEARYGLELVDSWRKNEEVWCEAPAGEGDSTMKSELKCYPYHQAHKKLDGRQADLFCEATNFVIDFSKVSGEVVGKGKPSKGSEYLAFSEGSLLSSCRKTAKYQERLFMPHHARQMRSFLPASSLEHSSTVDTTTYLLARDEDCENSFHSTADFMNMLLVYKALGLKAEDVQAMLWDKFADGPYYELISKAYSPKHPVLRHTHYRGKVLFKRLVFHLESPAGLIFPKVARPDPLRCHGASLFEAYRRHVLQAFDLLDVPPPAIPTITLSLRHRTQQKNVGRVLANEEEVVAVLKKGNMVNVNVVDTATMTYSDQLKLIRSTNVLVGVHGAGLMFIMFAAEEAVLVEIHPSYRQDRHFRHAARMTGKIYMPLRTLQRETCVGSSDSVTVPVDEFQRTIDGAVRIARNFDRGIAECGLVCPGAILALDSSLNNHYKPGERRSAPVNTQFPC